MSTVPRIHQFSVSTAEGDGVTNGMIYTHKLLRQLGFESEIYAKNIPSGLYGQVRSYADFKDSQCDLLLYHHSLGHEEESWLFNQHCPKALIYHNITPAHHFAPDSLFHRYSLLGRQQLHDWKDKFCAVIGDSRLNSEELLEIGYSNVQTIPLLVDLDRLSGSFQKPAFIDHIKPEAPLLLATGRLVENKRQHLLISALSYLLDLVEGPNKPHLVITGGITSYDYTAALHQYVHTLHLQQQVHFIGKCADNELRWLYRNANQYWCASEHEGFCMPLIESSYFGLPAVAIATSNIPDTLGEAGLILEDESPLAFACASHALLTDNELRKAVIDAGQRNLQRFSAERLLPQLSNWLAELGFMTKYAA